jgi:hypothetical protein
MSRSSTPDLPPQDLWSSILDSVSRSRSIPAKQVLILGQPSSGKSTIASALLQKPPSDDPSEAILPDFALGYDWADVRDEGDEGKTTLSRSLCSDDETPFLREQISWHGCLFTPYHHPPPLIPPSYPNFCPHDNRCRIQWSLLLSIGRAHGPLSKNYRRGWFG